MEVLSSGCLTTVQDSGRLGLRRFGEGVGGPLDALAAQVGNLMLCNPADAAFIEVVVFPLRLRFDHALRIAVTGSDVQMEVDGQRFPPWWSVVVQPGQVLTLRAPQAGGVAYLCVSGGIDVPLVLGSRSTDLKAGFHKSYPKCHQARRAHAAPGRCVGRAAGQSGREPPSVWRAAALRRPGRAAARG
ncbi:MAG: hypothetical protein RSB42_10490 [Comamonas sp.]